MVRGVETHIQDQLLIFVVILRELLRRQSSFELHYKGVSYVCKKSLLICLKWFEISVDRIILVMICLTFQY